MDGIPRSQPFALVGELWHALESTRVDKALPENKMRCGIVVRTRLKAMTVQGGDPEPTPWCLSCVEKFSNPT